MPKKKVSLTARLAGWSAAHPWKATLLWLLFVAVTIAAGSGTQKRQATEAELLVGESAAAARIIEEGSLRDPAVENILITMPGGGALAKEPAAKAVTDLKSRLGALSEVETVAEPLPAADGKALLLRVRMKGDADTANTRVEAIETVTAEARRSHPGLRFDQAGSASITNEFQEWIGKDIAKATTISVPVTLAILVLAFGSFVMAGVPVLLALSAVGSVLGLWTLVSHLVPDPGMVPDIIVLMGMAVGVDYSLFYLRRYREEKQAGRDNVDAVEIAAATSGHAVVVSGIAAVLSLAALYLADDIVFRSLGTGAILVVAVAVLASVTVLPALLAKIGPRLDRPGSRFMRRLKRKKRPNASPRLWNAMLRPVLRHPVISLILSVGALLALAYPALSMDLKSTQIDDFPRSLTTMQSYDRVHEHFPSSGNTVLVATEVPGGETRALRSQLTALADRARQDPLFAGDIDPETRFSADDTTGVLVLSTPYESDSEQARQAVHRLRDDLVPATVGTISGASYAVGGEASSDMDYTANLKDKLPLVVGAVLALTFLVMLIAFRSVVIGLTTVLLNLLSSAASFGLLCLVFEGTWAEDILSFKSTGHVVSWVPMLLFVVLSGLSLDYHVFVVTRIREEAMSGMTTRNAVASGIARTAGVVTSAAVVMVAVFSIFGTLSFIELKQIGVGLAAAIVLDATIIRIVVLPAMMSLLGKSNWWPGLRRRQDPPQADPLSPGPESPALVTV
ncbi:MMPL family transporter [Actinoplanes sp. NPDC051346]|uniref:MMPL family transporter n=1 Tax=Actinoplanes sp. NPDC051346 TaxID=3155048 RepID=UPI0034316BB7